MSAKSGGVAAAVTPAAERTAEELGLTLWDVEFVREGAAWFLRFFIDREGGISIDDCEAFHRKIDPIIDELDPIAQSYTLEVSSPGVERELKKPAHFEYALDRRVRVRLYRPDALGRRELTGRLVRFQGDELTLDEDGTETLVSRRDAARIRLMDEDAFGGME